MKIIAGVLMMILGVAIVITGAYTGVWIMLIGGIVDIVNQFKATETDSAVIAIAIAKIIFFELPLAIGIWLGGLLGFGGLALAASSNVDTSL